MYDHEYGNSLESQCKLSHKPCTLRIKPSKDIILVIWIKNIVKK